VILWLMRASRLVEVEALDAGPSPIEVLIVPAAVEHCERILGKLDRIRRSWAPRIG